MVNKKVLFFMALFLFVCPALAFADVAARDDFNGTWTGSITIDEENYSFDFRIVITSSGVSQYFQNEDGTLYVVNPADSFYLLARNNLVYAWVDQGGIWSETQTYSLSFVNSGTLDVVYTRHVNNYYEGASNETWNITGKGRLTKGGSTDSGSGGGSGGGGGCDVGTGWGFVILALAAAPLLRKWLGRNRPQS